MSKIIRGSRIKHSIKIIPLEELRETPLRNYVSQYILAWDDMYIKVNEFVKRKEYKKVEPTVIFNITNVKKDFFLVKSIYGRHNPENPENNIENNFGYIRELSGCMKDTSWLLINNRRYVKEVARRCKLHSYLGLYEFKPRCSHTEVS